MSRTQSVYREKDRIVEMSEISMDDDFPLSQIQKDLEKSLRPERHKNQCKILPESKSKNINENIWV